MRCLKYIAHLCIQLAILVAMIDAQDKFFSSLCNKRLDCYNGCNKAYFPSLFCQNTTHFTYDEKEIKYKITMNGNDFTTFYKYPDPNYVIENINHEDRIQKGFLAAPPANGRRLEGEAPANDDDKVASNEA